MSTIHLTYRTVASSLHIAGRVSVEPLRAWVLRREFLPREFFTERRSKVRVKRGT